MMPRCYKRRFSSKRSDIHQAINLSFITKSFMRFPNESYSSSNYQKQGLEIKSFVDSFVEHMIFASTNIL
jgi:hypothetical protein